MGDAPEHIGTQMPNTMKRPKDVLRKNQHLHLHHQRLPKKLDVANGLRVIKSVLIGTTIMGDV